MRTLQSFSANGYDQIVQGRWSRKLPRRAQ
jgi:hypothetical protein